MKKKRLVKQMMIITLSFAVLTGCSQPIPTQSPGDLPPADQFEAVRQAADSYLSGSRITALLPEQLYSEYITGRNSDYYLIDIRAGEDFAAGNIRGSVSIPYAQTASLKKLENLPQDKTLVIIDYNGHWAAQTAATWNMLGYKAVPLKYGIQSWSEEPGPTGYEIFPAQALYHPLVTERKAPEEFVLPELKMTAAQTEEMVCLIAGTYLDRNYKGFIEAQDLMTAITDGSAEKDNFLIDIRQPEHYESGHVPGAVNIPLAELAKADQLKYLPEAKRIVVIGYDGMDGSQAARVLVTLGYNAVALKYGMSYWSAEAAGIEPIHNLVQDHYELTPLNYVKPSSGPAGCG